MPGDVISAEELNSLFEEHIDQPLEDAHPPVKEKLYQHMDSTTAHNLPERLRKVLDAHVNDPQAHFDVVNAVQAFLGNHTHDELRLEVDRRLRSLIDAHKAHGHEWLRSTFGKAFVGPEPPPGELPVNFLWLNTEDDELYIYRGGGSWQKVDGYNPFSIEGDKPLWGELCAVLCAELFYPNGEIPPEVKEKLDWLDWSWVGEALKEVFDEILDFARPKNYLAEKVKFLENPVETPPELPQAVKDVYFTAWGIVPPLPEG